MFSLFLLYIFRNSIILKGLPFMIRKECMQYHIAYNII